MTENMETRNCQLCGREITCGLQLRRKSAESNLFLCYACHDLILGVACGLFNEFFDAASVSLNKGREVKLEEWMRK